MNNDSADPAETNRLQAIVKRLAWLCAIVFMNGPNGIRLQGSPFINGLYVSLAKTTSASFPLIENDLNDWVLELRQQGHIVTRNAIRFGLFKCKRMTNINLKRLRHSLHHLDGAHVLWIAMA